MNYWLKAIGSAKNRLDPDWLSTRSDLLDKIKFGKTKRPSGISRDDRLVLYAARWECFFGVAVVTSVEPRWDPSEEKWPWVLDVKVPLLVPRLDLAPRLSEMGVANTSVRQQSHIALTREQFEKAVGALVAVVV
jgi:hypothetical protein